MTKVVADRIYRAECIVFLGFAYHDPNMLLLKPGEQIDVKPIFGTAYGMSEADVGVVSNELRAWLKEMNASVFQSRVRIENKLKCADLFDYYAKSLTAAR
jgi:hypothetical protein